MCILPQEKKERACVSKRKLDVSEQAVRGFWRTTWCKHAWTWPTFLVLVFSVGSCFQCTKGSRWLGLASFRCQAEKPRVTLFQRLLLVQTRRQKRPRTVLSVTEEDLGLRRDAQDAAEQLVFRGRVPSAKGTRTLQDAGCSPGSIAELLDGQLTPLNCIWNGVNEIYHELDHKKMCLKVMDVIQFLFFSSHSITHTVLLVQCVT